MPTYEYECTKCSHTFEAFQSMSDKPISKCPKCKNSVKRLIHGGLGVIFKGSGFYSTDNKRGSVLSGSNGGSNKESGKDSGKDSAVGKPAENPSASKKESSPEKAAAS
jgi:putative FmdB family regulatory protein